jgi:hypothetical protein
MTVDRVKRSGLGEGGRRKLHFREMRQPSAMSAYWGVRPGGVGGGGAGGLDNYIDDSWCPIGVITVSFYCLLYSHEQVLDQGLVKIGIKTPV